MFPSFIAIFIASLLGSTHCAAMCGGFVTLASVDSNHTVYRQFAYHFGRLITYIILGAIAGVIGGALNLAGEYAGIGEVAAVLTGCIMLIIGISRLMGGNSKSSSARFFSKFSSSLYQPLVKRAKRHIRFLPFMLGLSSTFLPCGWLYSYVIVAAASGNWVNGILVMSVFWLGTVPALSLIGFFTRRVSSRFQNALVTALIILAGLITLSQRIWMIQNHSIECEHHHQS